MYRICLGLLLLIFGTSLAPERKKEFNFNFQQSDYRLSIERMDVVRYNKQLVNQFHLRTFKYNRTCTAFNLTINYDFSPKNRTEIVVQAYKFASNEYRLFPLRFQYNFCVAVSLHMFGYGENTKCGNFTECGCLKGRTYHLCNWIPDEKKFPPYIPSGSYMVELQGMYFSTELWVVHAYGTVWRPFVKK